MPVRALRYPVAAQAEYLQVVQVAKMGDAFQLVLVQHQILDGGKQPDRSIDHRQLVFLKHRVAKVFPLLQRREK